LTGQRVDDFIGGSVAVDKRDDLLVRGAEKRSGSFLGEE